MKQSRKSAPAPELAALRAELRDAQSELALAYRQFDQATAPELVEWMGRDAAHCGRTPHGAVRGEWAGVYCPSLWLRSWYAFMW